MAKKKETKQEETKEIKFYTEELKKSKTINEDTVKIISFIIIAIIVIGLLIGLFYINGKYVTKDKYQDATTTTTTEAIYDDTQVIVDDMFNKSNDDYYVVAYDKEDVDGKFIYDSSLYFSNEKIKLYKLDLTNAMNKMYYNKDKTENLNTANKKDINFTKSTLLVFKKGKVAEVITNKDDIVKKLNTK